MLPFEVHGCRDGGRMVHMTSACRRGHTCAQEDAARARASFRTRSKSSSARARRPSRASSSSSCSAPKRRPRGTGGWHGSAGGLPRSRGGRAAGSRRAASGSGRERPRRSRAGGATTRRRRGRGRDRASRAGACARSRGAARRFTRPGRRCSDHAASRRMERAPAADAGRTHAVHCARRSDCGARPRALRLHLSMRGVGLKQSGHRCAVMFRVGTLGQRYDDAPIG
eukprot:6186037-Pleurochrysis_carterae.AAC.7